MEHNEYSFYSVKCEISIRISRPDNDNAHKYLETKIYNIIAPTDEEIGLPLITFTLKRESWDKDKFKIMEIVSKVKLDHIIRFENAYRARL